MLSSHLITGSTDLNAGGFLAHGLGAGRRDDRHAHQPGRVQQDQVRPGRFDDGLIF